MIQLKALNSVQIHQQLPVQGHREGNLSIKQHTQQILAVKDIVL